MEEGKQEPGRVFGEGPCAAASTGTTAASWSQAALASVIPAARRHGHHHRALLRHRRQEQQQGEKLLGSYEMGLVELFLNRCWHPLAASLPSGLARRSL